MLRRFALLVVATAAATGCNLPPMDVWVYIDNSSNEPMVISVDGQKELTLPPGDVAELNYPPGEHQFLIRSGSETICDLTRNLEQSDQFGVPRKYLFDPHKGHRYQTYDAQYGESFVGDLLESSLFGMQKDPAAQQQYVYKQLLKFIELVPSDAWNDISGVDYVLEAPPDEIYTDGMEKCKVLDRIDREFYERLTAAKNKQNLTEEDVDVLSELVMEILAQSL